MDITALLSQIAQLGIQLWVLDGKLKFKAPAGALTPELKAEISANKATLIRFLEEQDLSRQETISGAPEGEMLWLSFGQKWLWTLSQLKSGVDAEYNIPSAMRLKGELDTRTLAESLNRIVRRHEILRTVYALDDSGEPYQIILPPPEVGLPVYDLTEQSQTAQNSEIKEEIEREMSHPFDLSKGPVFRAKLYKLGAREHVLLLVFHHIVCDNQSLHIFLSELTTIYQAEVRGEEAKLPELKIRYADYAVWQKMALSGDLFDRELSYWREVLGGVEEAPEINGDRERSAETSTRSIREFYTMPASKTQGLKVLSRKMGCSFYAVLLSLFKILLFQYSGNRDITIGSPVAGRGREELEPLMGVFFNTVAVRGDKIEPSMKFTDYISAMHTAAAGAFKHQEIPFEHLVKKLKLGVLPNKTPVFSALFNMYGVQYQSDRNGLAIEPFDSSVIGGQNINSKFDITLLAIEHEEGLQIDFSFKADLYRAETVSWLIAQFKILTSAVVEQPEQLISELPALHPIPRTYKADAEDAWQTAYIRVPLEDTEQSIIQCFDRQAALFPEKNAVEMNGEKLTYRELQNASVNLREFIVNHVDTLPRLSRKELRRYGRQNALDGWGVYSQEKLKGLTVFAAGAGGSGSPVIMQLALMGVGTIIICDFDIIEDTNLNRQFLHDEDRIGMNKAKSAALSVKRVNSHINIIVREEKIDRDNIDGLVGDSAIIFDNVDDLEAKFILSECAVRKGIPHVISSNIERSSYAAIFHTPHTPCFHCCYDKSRLNVAREFHAELSGWERVGNPVVSPPLFLSAGFAVGEAIKIVLGFENPAYNRFFLFNNQSSSIFPHTMGFKRITYPFSMHFINTAKRHGFDWEEGFNGRFVEEIPIERDPDCVMCQAEQATDVSPLQPKKFSCEDPNMAVILMNQCIGAVMAVMGILRSGYAFVFISPDYPAERLEYILKDTGAHLIMTDDENEELAYHLREKINRNIAVLNIRCVSTEAPLAQQTQTPYGPDQLAYIVYTSGSTGTPKGVMQTHRNVLHYTMNYVNGLRIGSGDRLSLIPSLTFSAAMMDIFAAFSTGATLCLYDIKEDGPLGLSAWLLENRVSVYHSVPTIFRRFAKSLEPGENLPDLRMIDLGGEPVTRAETALFRERFHPACTLINGLGATELNVIAQYKIKSGATVDGNVAVGYPAEDTEILLLDPDGNPVGYNQPGELVLKSAYLSPGYWSMKEQTDALFKQETGTNKRLFHTGDIGLRRTDGCLEHLGRSDLQLKIRGIRIEPLEIEAVLKTLPKIQDAVVCAVENQRGEKCIAAYFVCRENQPMGVDEVASCLRQTLPEYMIPSVLTHLDALPLTTTGKVDRSKLRNLGEVKFEVSAHYAPPTNDTEKKLSELWRKALSADKVGIHDSFFDLGGNSLSAIDLVNSIKTEMGGDLSILDILKHPTIAQMSHCIKLLAD